MRFRYAIIATIVMLTAVGCLALREPGSEVSSVFSYPDSDITLECRMSGARSDRTATMYAVVNGRSNAVSTYGGENPMAMCEFARRSSRNDKLCAMTWSPYGIRHLVMMDVRTGQTLQDYSRWSQQKFEECLTYTRAYKTLPVRRGHVQFMKASELGVWKSRLPRVNHRKLIKAFRSDDTVWYDERSMVFTYQDSLGSPIGLRANRVGYDHGSTAPSRDIQQLTKYFKPGSYEVPFDKAFGTTFSDRVYVMNFWVPPRDRSGRVLPVKVWKSRAGSRGDGSKRYAWVFPNNTVFGEILFMPSPESNDWYAFEIRMRTRYAEGWDVDVFRPFRTAQEMADAIKEARPRWGSNRHLVKMVRHLETENNLVPFTFKPAPAYRPIFEPIAGSLDYLPEVADYQLIASFLRERSFNSVVGEIWKSHGDLETYAPTTKARFSIVPRDYTAGVIPVNEESCKRCHESAGLALDIISHANDDDIEAYGEIWGEDQIFTWHPFKIDMESFSVSDFSRRLNPDLVRSGLVQMVNRRPNDGIYRPLSKRFARPIRERESW